MIYSKTTVRDRHRMNVLTEISHDNNLILFTSNRITSGLFGPRLA